MKITDVQTFTMGTEWRNLVFVKVSTDEGIYGIGEATISNGEEAVVAYITAAAKRHVIGSDPFQIEDLWLRLFRNDFWQMGVIGYTGISAIEIACWDIVGKALGVPVYKLLGGACHLRLKAYANGWYTVDRTPEQFAAAAARVVQLGYRALKLDPFGAGQYELDHRERMTSIGLLEAVRHAVGDDVEIMVEGHGRFSPMEAVRLAHELNRFFPAWFEEPIPPDNIAGLGEVKRSVSIPIAAGERWYTRFGFREAFERRAVDIIQPDVIHAGGLAETKKIAASAEMYHMLVAPHNSQGPVATAASVHLGFTLSNLKVQECFDDMAEPFILDAVPGAPRVRDGYFHLPEGAGLGIELNEQVIREHPYRFGHFDLWEENWHRRKSKRWSRSSAGGD
jgi:galactonate dehydratase